MVGAFGGLALLLAALGVYGVISFLVSQRTQELGVRAAMGARAWDLMGLVLGRAAVLGVAGILLGGAGALAVTGLLESLLFGVSATDPVTFGGVALVLFAVSLLAGLLPALRAARVDPLVTLRYE